MYSFQYFCIIICYCKLLLKINNQALLKTIQNSNTNINKILNDVNDNCKIIFTYNLFWKKYKFYFIYTAIPSNLLILYQLLCVETNLFNNGFNLSLSIIGIFSLFPLNIMIASINKRARISYKLLYELYLKSNLNINYKLKVM